MNFARLIRAANATSLTMPVAPVPFDRIGADTGGFTSAADLTRFTIPAGVTHVSLAAGVRLSDSTEAGGIFLSIRKNGAVIPNLFHYGRNGASTATNSRFRDVYAPIVDVVEGDYLDVRINYSGTSAATQINSAFQTMFEISDRTGFQGCLADRSANLTSISWPLLPIPYDRALLDTGDFFNAATGEITIPPGVSQVEAWAGFRTPDDAAYGTLIATIFKNGALVPDLQRPHIRNNTAGAGFNNNHAWVRAPRIEVSPGDVLTARGNKTGLGSTESILSDATTIFGCRVIPPLATPGTLKRWRRAVWFDASAGNSLFGPITVRTRIAASAIERTGSLICLQLPRFATLPIEACHIGKKSGDYGFVDPQQVFFEGSPNTLATSSNGNAIYSDPLPFDLDGEDDLIVSMYFSANATYATNLSTPGFSWTTSGDDAANPSPSGYTALSVRRPIQGIFVYD